MESILITDGGDTVSRVLIGRGVRADAAALIGGNSYRRIAVFSQRTVDEISSEVSRSLAASSGATVSVQTLPDREEAKTIEVAERSYRWLNDLGMTRGDLIVAIGGGSLTDAAGFVAGTYLRGVDAVFVPTTLLGAVDAAIGGKAALNLDGKNLVGVFKHPDRVIVDLEILEALPAELLKQGHAEALKAGFIADANLVELYERGTAAASIDEIVRRAIAVKAEVVSDDFRETGRRAILNFGHTVGHAVETLSDLSHGEAVAVGMVAAAAASREELGFEGEDRISAVVESVGLPIRAPALDGREVRAAMQLDKKRDASGLRMVLLEDFGRPVLKSVDAATVTVALEAIGLE